MLGALWRTTIPSDDDTDEDPVLVQNGTEEEEEEDEVVEFPPPPPPPLPSASQEDFLKLQDQVQRLCGQSPVSVYHSEPANRFKALGGSDEGGDDTGPRKWAPQTYLGALQGHACDFETGVERVLQLLVDRRLVAQAPDLTWKVAPSLSPEGPAGGGGAAGKRWKRKKQESPTRQQRAAHALHAILMRETHGKAKADLPSPEEVEVMARTLDSLIL
jgi:hypothetical protein